MLSTLRDVNSIGIFDLFDDDVELLLLLLVKLYDFEDEPNADLWIDVKSWPDDDDDDYDVNILS